MIKGVHAMFYSNQAEELRAFIRDKLQFTYTDVGGGWLIFDVPEGDVGVHPTDEGGTSGQHDISFYCDDLEATVKELTARGVTFDSGISDQGFGLVTHLTMPGGVKLMLYQPRYQKTKHAAPAPAKKKAKPAAKKKAAPKKKAAAKKAKPAAKKKAAPKKKAAAKKKAAPKAKAKAKPKKKRR